MGICTSSRTSKAEERGGGESSFRMSTAKIIHVDGRLQEFRQPTTTGHVISQNPNCFLCSSESMNLDSCVPRLADDEELQIGQIYFLLPLSQSNNPLSLSNLCALAIKASKALGTKHNLNAPTTFSRSRSTVVGLLAAGSQAGCKVPTGLDVASQVGRARANRRGIGY
uniref:Uncharacterized protein n=1 Tax=Nelumbo nucifera TaxID=4432 RepID=A0A822XRR7_NELNU|nr:TPA_asm: hypothetical protein HUJ06_023252 [Nelumbo nucifera]